MRRFLVLLSSLLATSFAQQCYDAGDKLISQRCFKLVNQKLSYADARNWCHYHNPISPSYLAIVTDQTISNFLASYARTAFNANGGFFWIGLSRANSTKFYWDNGQPLVWNNIELQTGQNYVAESISNGRWTTYSGDVKMNFVCSYDPNAPPTFSPFTGSTPPVTEATDAYTTQATEATTGWSDVTPTPTEYICDSINAPSTFLFAYSTEMVPSVLSATKSKILQVLSANPKNNVNFADVRFDCDNGSVINYHNDLQSFSLSIDSNPPDRSLMFPDNSNNTDIFLVLENFLNNTQIPLCGSTVIVLTKRYTKINRSFKMNWKLLEEHITVHFIQSNYMPYGGVIGSTNDVSGFTGGLYVLTGANLRLNDSTFPDVADKIMDAPYHQNLLFSYYNYLGTVNTTDLNIGSLKVPMNQEPLINVTLAITTDIVDGYDSYYFQSINLTLIDKVSYQRTVFSYGYSDLFSNSDLIYKPIQLKSGSNSDVLMSYSTRLRGRTQIRMYIDQPLGSDKQLIKEIDQLESFGVEVPNSLITF